MSDSGIKCFLIENISGTQQFKNCTLEECQFCKKDSRRQNLRDGMHQEWNTYYCNHPQMRIEEDRRCLCKTGPTVKKGHIL